MEEVDHRCKSQQQQLFELKQQLTNDTAELKLRLAQAKGNLCDAVFFCFVFLTVAPKLRSLVCPPVTPDRLEMEKQRSKQALEDMNSLRQKEVQNK